MNKKNILVFGGTGFLGVYLVKELLTRNYLVSVADIKPFSNDMARQIENFYVCDILHRDKIHELIYNQHFDIIYNLAGFANLDKAPKHPAETIELNVMGNLNILEAAKEKKIKKYVYASSAYALSNKGSFYGISKLSSEKIIEEYQKKYGLNFTILRYGSVYAEKKFNNNYIYQLLEKAIATGRIEHSSDGQEIREYIHASDAASLSVDIIENQQFNNQHIILTGTEKIKRYELFNLINEILNNKLTITLRKDANYQHHYKYSPYSFEPSKSYKLVANPHIDIGQGILACIRNIYEKQSAVNS